MDQAPFMPSTTIRIERFCTSPRGRSPLRPRGDPRWSCGPAIAWTYRRERLTVRLLARTAWPAGKVKRS